MADSRGGGEKGKKVLSFAAKKARRVQQKVRSYNFLLIADVLRLLQRFCVVYNFNVPRFVLLVTNCYPLLSMSA